ncbi:MAG: hypothetical protein AAFY65_01200 [Pseudomonadota bacterium]
MTLSGLIRESLWSNPDQWSFHHNERYLRIGTVELVRNLSDDKWRYIVPGIGQVLLPLDVQWKISWMRRGLRVKRAQNEEQSRDR